MSRLSKDELIITINNKPTNIHILGVAFDDVELIDRALEMCPEFKEALEGRDIKCITHYPDGRIDYRVGKWRF